MVRLLLLLLLPRLLLLNFCGYGGGGGRCSGIVDGTINNASLINCLGQVAILTILKHFHILENFPHNHFVYPPAATATMWWVGDYTEVVMMMMMTIIMVVGGEERKVAEGRYLPSQRGLIS